MTASGRESAEPIVHLLAERIGLDPASVGETLIHTGIRNRMKTLGLARLADYERILHGPTDEVQALIEEVVIPESWFFRDDRPFAAFRAIARVGWVDQPHRAPLSVLCLPCAGGEEPYSVVMTLLDLGLPRERFEVVAVDISERSILRAARGIYGQNAFRGVPDAIRAQYFEMTESPGRYLIRATVRAGVRFERGNILAPDLLATSPGFDVVFCRNLLIYFDDAARIRAAQNLDRLAAADGFLFLGHADRPDPTLLARFAQHGDPGSFLYRRQVVVPSPPEIRLTPAIRSSSSAPLGISPSPPTRVDPVDRSTPRPRASLPSSVSAPPHRPLPPAPPPRAVSTESPTSGALGGDRDEALAQAAALADRGQYGEAANLVRRHLGRGPLDAPAHFLLGMIHQAAGDRASAEAELLKAVYLDPDHDEALLALALLARRRGDVAAEALMRRRADRVRVRKERS